MVLPIQKIIEDGVTAPSGENCQPWKFIIQGNILFIFNIPEADQSLYNSMQKGSYIAHGALIENISISAKEHGYTVEVSLFPDKNNDTHIATIVFIEAKVVIDTLYKSLYTRCTNRKEYTGETLNEKEKDNLMNSFKDFDDISLTIIDDKKQLQILGQALALNERILFENKKIHDFFYGHIIWDKKDEGKSGGFFIDTLEFLPRQLVAVKIFKHWGLLSFLNAIVGVSKKISKENGEKYTVSGSLAAVSTKGTTREYWVRAGRAMQRIWLTAALEGLAVHPCNGTLYFMEQISDGGEKEFSKDHSTLIRNAYKKIVDNFNLKDEHITFIFRIGRADAPSAQAKRIMPIIEFITKP